MLITLHNSSADANYYLQDFNENIIIPKNAIVKLRQAFVPKTQLIVIETGVNDTIKITQGGSGAEERSITISAGNYDLNTLMTAINSQIESVCNDDATKMNWNIKGDFHRNPATESDIGKLKMRIACLSNEPNFMGWALYENADVVYWDEFIKYNDPVIVTYTLNDTSTGTQFVAPSSYFGCSALNDGGGLALTNYRNYWYYDADKASNIERDWFSPTSDNTLDYPPNADEEYGAFRFTINVLAGKDWWIGLTNEKPDVDGTTPIVTGDNDLSNMTGVNCMIQKIGVAKTIQGIAYAEGDVVVYEWTGWTMAVVNYWSGCVAGDAFSVVIGGSSGANEYLKYFRYTALTNAWTPLGINATTRYTIEDEEYYLCGGFYNRSASSANGDLQIRDIGMSMLAETYIADNFGERLEVDLDTLQTTLGFSKATFTDNVTTGLSKIEADNDEKAVHTGMCNIPFVNVNIRNLPIVSYTNTNTSLEGLSISRTLGVLSRFDVNGDLDADGDGQQGLYNYMEQPAVRLNNKEEIVMSRLEVDLRNSDGSIPIDLATPSGFVIEITQSLQDG